MSEIDFPVRSRLRVAMALAVLADVLQMAVFPLFIEGAASPADDVLDAGMAAVLTYLLGWHWEFLPSFAVKLVPGLDLAPLWTLAVANVYRKSRRAIMTAGVTAGETESTAPAHDGRGS